MNQTRRISVALLAVVLGPAAAWAGNLSCSTSGVTGSCGPVTVTANVTNVFGLDCTLVRCLDANANGLCEVAEQTQVTTMDFQNLARRYGPDADSNGVPDNCNFTTQGAGQLPCALIGPHHFRTFCGASNNSGKHYLMRHKAAPLAAGATQMPGWVAYPLFKGTAPGTLGHCGLAKNNVTMYDSDPAGAAAVVETLYSITDQRPVSGGQAICTSADIPEPFPVVPPNQAAGSYQASVTIEMIRDP